MNREFMRIMRQFMNAIRFWIFSVLILCIGFSVSFGADIPAERKRTGK